MIKLTLLTLMLSVSTSFAQDTKAIITPSSKIERSAGITSDINSIESFEALIRTEKKICVVKFFAEWCGYCKRMQKPFEAVANNTEYEKFRFIEIDIDKAADLASKYGVRGIPNTLIFKEGEKIASFYGYRSEDGIKQELAKIS